MLQILWKMSSTTTRTHPGAAGQHWEGLHCHQGSSLDAATRRAHKIRRFQLERAVRAELDALKMQVTLLFQSVCAQCTWH